MKLSLKKKQDTNIEKIFHHGEEKMPNVTKYSRKLCQLLLIRHTFYYALWCLTEIVLFTNIIEGKTLYQQKDYDSFYYSSHFIAILTLLQWSGSHPQHLPGGIRAFLSLDDGITGEFNFHYIFLFGKISAKFIPLNQERGIR